MRLVPERHDSDLLAERTELLELEAKYENWRGRFFRNEAAAERFVEYLKHKAVKGWQCAIRDDDGIIGYQVTIDDREPLKALRAIDDWSADVKIPNKETQKAMREAEQGISLSKPYDSAKELFDKYR
jgi:hypothetical protein